MTKNNDLEDKKLKLEYTKLKYEFYSTVEEAVKKGILKENKSLFPTYQFYSSRSDQNKSSLDDLENKLALTAGKLLKLKKEQNLNIKKTYANDPNLGDGKYPVNRDEEELFQVQDQSTLSSIINDIKSINEYGHYISIVKELSYFDKNVGDDDTNYICSHDSAYQNLFVEMLKIIKNYDKDKNIFPTLKKELKDSLQNYNIKYNQEMKEFETPTLFNTSKKSTWVDRDKQSKNTIDIITHSK